MRKIAALGEIEEGSVITYIVDGLKLSDDLKFPMYSAATFKELRKRYELVEAIAKNKSMQKKRPAVQIKNQTRGQGEAEKINARKQQHCYNCGSSQHKRAECKSETKCFKCNGVGHMSKHCENVKKNISVIRNGCRLKQMTIDGTAIECLVDTGADVSLMYKKMYDRKLNTRLLRKCFAKLYGLGNIGTAVLGEFMASVEVDGIKPDHKSLVVPDAKLNVDAIVGYDFLQKFTITLNANGYKFTPIDDADHNPNVVMLSDKIKYCTQ